MTPERGQSRAKVLLEPADLVGFELAGRYRLDSVIGEGGMGVVFRSHQKGVHRDIAIKLLKPGSLNAQRRMDRFEREISIISNLSHPNIVRVFDSGRDERLRLHFIAMELVKGISLDTVLRSHLMKPELALEVTYQICGALTEPHEQDIIHRDIKPENTLLVARADDTLQVKVLDFGIARSHRGDGRVTTTGVVMGTPRYMAPESVQGAEIDARTDLYAVGIMLFEMLVGKAPFAANTPVATMLQHVTQEAPPLHEALRGFQYREITRLVSTLLAKDPDKRPASAREVRNLIDEIRDIYGFGRVRIMHSDRPLDALSSWLIPREFAEGGPSLLNTEGWSTANSFDLTERMRADEDGLSTASDHLIPVPVNVARAHLQSQGLPAEASFVNEDGQTESLNLDDAFEETNRTPSPTGAGPQVAPEQAHHAATTGALQAPGGFRRSHIVAVVSSLVAVGVVAAWIVSSTSERETVEIGSVGAPSSPKEVPVTPTPGSTTKVVDDAAMNEATTDVARALGEGIVEASQAFASSTAQDEKVEKPAPKSERRRPKPVSTSPESTAKPVDGDPDGNEDEFQKGLEWIRK